MKRLAKRMLRSDLPLPQFARPVFRGLRRFGIFVREGFRLAKKWLIVSPITRSIADCGKGLEVESLPYVRGQGRFQLGDRVRLSGKSNYRFLEHVGGDPELVIGSDVFIGNGCVFSVADRIEVGDRTMIAGGVRIADNSGHPLDPAARQRNEPITAADTAPVTIGQNVWIATGASVLKGVAIGDHSIVAAGSIVTKDVPPNTVVAGNPAKVVKELDPPEPLKASGTGP